MRIFSITLSVSHVPRDGYEKNEEQKRTGKYPTSQTKNISCEGDEVLKRKENANAKEGKTEREKKRKKKKEKEKSKVKEIQRK